MKPRWSARTAAAVAWLVALHICGPGPVLASEIAPGLVLDAGPINGVSIHREGQALVLYGGGERGLPEADLVLFTHHRRDVVDAGRALVEAGARAVAPAAEVGLFTDVEGLWSDFREARFHDYDQQTTKILVRALPVSRAVSGGETVDWHDLAFRVLDTPGYTRGAVSYVVDVEGVTVAFTGDLIHGDGQLFDLYSLQDKVPGSRFGGYHGFLARLPDVLDSLDRVLAHDPDVLVPARGPVIRDPVAAVDRLRTRSRAVYESFLFTDGLRWYSGDEAFERKARRVLGETAQVATLGEAELREELPEWLTPIRNTRLIRSADGSGFVLDCGSGTILEELMRLRDIGELASLDHVWITHYHDDHTQMVPDLVEEFGSTVYAVQEMVEVLERPQAFRLPAATDRPIPVSARLGRGATWRWKEFQIEASYFPGQTRYHQGLLVTHDSGESVFFVGDSFGPTGVDDYCPQNRVFLHEGMGFFDCLEQIRRLPEGTWLVNQHIEPAFRFSPEQIDRIEATLRERIGLLRDLVPWDDPNDGLDEGWARFRPYGTATRPGERVQAEVVLMNHAPEPREMAVRVRSPLGWSVRGPAWTRLRIPPGQEGVARVELIVPADAAPGVHVVTADVERRERTLLSWTEMMVEVLP